MERIRDFAGQAAGAVDIGRRLAWQVVQKVGARAIDRAVWQLGLGRGGVRLTGGFLDDSTEEWQAEIAGWSSGAVAEASELLAMRALASTFDLGSGGESAAIEGLRLRWLTDAVRSQAGRGQAAAGGTVLLAWSRAERESFRRGVLARIASGDRTELCLFGCDRVGIKIVEVEIEVHAVARARLAANPKSVEPA